MNSYVLINRGDNLRGYELEDSHAPLSLIAFCNGYSFTFWQFRVGDRLRWVIGITLRY